MKLQLLVVVALGFVLGGCTTYRTVAVADSCAGKASDKPKVVRVKFRERRNDKTKIEEPPVACVHPGDLLMFRIDTKKRKNATVTGKIANPDNAWIRGGTNTRKRWFWVAVPYDILEADEDEKSFFYDITVEDFPDIDPEVRVRKPK